MIRDTDNVSDVYYDDLIFGRYCIPTSLRCVSVISTSFSPSWLSALVKKNISSHRRDSKLSSLDLNSILVSMSVWLVSSTTRLFALSAQWRSMTKDRFQRTICDDLMLCDRVFGWEFVIHSLLQYSMKSERSLLSLILSNSPQSLHPHIPDESSLYQHLSKGFITQPMCVVFFLVSFLK